MPSLPATEAFSAFHFSSRSAYSRSSLPISSSRAASERFAPSSSSFFSASRSIFSRSEEHTSELQSLMRISYAVFCLQQKNHLEYNQLHIKHDNKLLLST